RQQTPDQASAGPLGRNRQAGVACTICLAPVRCRPVRRTGARTRDLPDLEISRAGQERVARLLHDGDPALAHRVADGVARQVVADVVPLGDAHVLVDDGPADARAAADVDV